MKNKCLRIVVIMFLFVFILAGCGDGFTEVASISFTTAGESRTLYSTWYINVGKYEISTREEYYNATFKGSVMAPNNVNVDTISWYTSDLFSGNIYNIKNKPYKPYGITEDDIGEYFYIFAHDLGAYTTSYYKVEITEVGSSYLQVKVKNDTTIVVKRGVNETTYTVTSYRLNK